MQNPFYIFKIKRSERWPALAALLYVVLWNVLVVYKYSDRFFTVCEDYHRLFVNTFHISGFDPLSYLVISHWDTGYNIYRHPLLAFFMFIPNQLDQLLIMLTGHNWAAVIMALILVFCGFYSFILLKRTLNEVIGLLPADSWLLSWFTFSFAYVMVSISVPDHFALSMFMLILTLYVAGRKIKAHHPFTRWQTILFFIVTAGISLNNGIKIFLANWFVNGKKFWRPLNLLIVVVVPSLVIWFGARMEWKHFERPKYIARQHIKAYKDSLWRANTYAAFVDTTSVQGQDNIKAAYNKLIQKRIHAKYNRDHKKAAMAHAGEPINKTEFGKWTDISTPRWPSLVENIFGEPIQLHQDYLLQDVLLSRPVIVHYRYAINYIIEGIIVLLFLVGIWYGRKYKLLWLALSFFAFDMVIHLALGFGLNEVYIMSPHWLFVITIAIGYICKNVKARKIMRAIVALLTIYLLLWNGIQYANFL